MIDEQKRAAVLGLDAAGHNHTDIAAALCISRNSVRRIIESGQAQRPVSGPRPRKPDAVADRVTELYRTCKGNLVRVQEVLADEGHAMGYATLRRWCKDQEFGVKAKTVTGTYLFGPGEEMQHDTSPHDVELGGVEHALQCAVLILGYSRMVYAQLYARWNRLTALSFLAEALEYFGGAAGRCVVDNGSVLVASGRGPTAVFAPAAVDLGRCFGFGWMAHAVRKPKRKGKVERRFSFVDGNFYAGRTFADLADCNRQLLQWCKGDHVKYRENWHASPADLFQSERQQLKPLPVQPPPIYVTALRLVDMQARVNYDGNRYAAPHKLVGERVLVRQYVDRIELYHDARHGAGPRLMATHRPIASGSFEKSPSLPGEHMPSPRPATKSPGATDPVSHALRAADAALGAYLDALGLRFARRTATAARQLGQLWRDHPHDAVLRAVEQAHHYGMFDLARLERMVLRQVAGAYFQLPLHGAEPGDPRSGDSRPG